MYVSGWSTVEGKVSAEVALVQGLRKPDAVLVWCLGLGKGNLALAKTNRDEHVSSTI
jgi:hypothetical protein